MDPVPKGLRERKKQQTRLELARAAVRLFEARGYDAVTVEDIAAEANVSRRTFFRYFDSKDEVFIIDPEGKIAAMRIALREGPPEESTLDALRRGSLALMEAYWDSELTLAVLRLIEREPKALAAAMAYQVRMGDALAHELAIDMGTDERLDPRPRILAHTGITLMRAAVATWLTDTSSRTPFELAQESFERSRPAFEAIMDLPVSAAAVSAA
jgi:AcrR family transcriptional regulator